MQRLFVGGMIAAMALTLFALADKGTTRQGRIALIDPITHQAIAPLGMIVLNDPDAI